MAVCKQCGKNIPRGKRYITETYKSYYFCSKECYTKFTTKPPKKTNYISPPKSDRRIFTDYLQEWTNDTINWEQAMKYAKDITNEYDLSWKDMYLILKYARVYESYQWDTNYGLGQIFPKFIQPYKDFLEAINKSKTTELPELTTYVVKRKKPYIGKVEW